MKSNGKTNGKTRRWTSREDELLLARGMYLDEFAELLGRSECEVWARAGELDVDLNLRGETTLPAAAEEPGEPTASDEREPADDPQLDVALDLRPSALPTERSALAMEAEAAERVGRRVALALYRGSIEHATAALADAWREHAGETELPQGAELLDVSLARVLDDVRLLNRLDEGGGMLTVGQFVERIEAWLQTRPRQIGETQHERLLGLRDELRRRAGLPDVARLPDTETVETKRRGRKPKPPAEISPELRAWCEQETVRLLPLIERIAFAARLPLPLEDLIQEGAKACFEALPRYNPNEHQVEGKPVKIETFVTPRIRGAMLDYARRAGYFLHGGQRTGRSESVVSLATPAPFEMDGRPSTLGQTLTDEAAPDPAVIFASRARWQEVLKGLAQRERLLVLEYFVHGKRLKAIGQDLGLSESRCSQLLSALIVQLRSIDQQQDGRIREALAQ